MDSGAPRQSAVKPKTLYVVSTPIGNLADITFRAVDVLRQVDFVLAEDTRHTRVLFEHYGIGTATHPLHEHNEAKSIPRIVGRLQDGECAALVSDAGTPLISDPGQRLVNHVWKAGLRVVPVPGPSALLAALAAAGLDTTTFTFFGFLPRTGSARALALRHLSAMQWTAVLYEAPARLCRTLDDLAAAGAVGRTAVVARELTKRFEELRRGTVEELAAYYRSMPPRGEVVIILQARDEEPHDDMKLREIVAELRREGRTARDITATLTHEYGVARNVAYRLAQES